MFEGGGGARIKKTSTTQAAVSITSKLSIIGRCLNNIIIIFIKTNWSEASHTDQKLEKNVVWQENSRSKGHRLRGEGSSFLGPAERSERRYLRNYEDVEDEDISPGGGQSGGVRRGEGTDGGAGVFFMQKTR